MKYVFLLFSALSSTIFSMAQAPVPTSWACEGAVPTGWVHNWQLVGTNQFYTGASQLCEGAAAARLDATNEGIVVKTASQPGRVVYSILGTGTSSWQGTFTVQESEDSITWTALKTYNTGQLPITGPCNYDSVLITNANVRYVRWFFTSKTSGYNIAIDNIKVRAPILTSQKIVVEQNSTPIVNGTFASPFNAPVSTPTSVNFLMKNVGTVQSLSVNSIQLSGPAAADYTVVAPTLPASISASSSTPLTLTFNPSVSGTRFATMTIRSNDPTEDSVYVVELYGVGGTLATEPSSQATNLNFPINKSYRTVVNFTNTTTDVYGGYIVLRSTGAPVSGIPTDGTNYNVGETIGNAKVVFKNNGGGVSTSFWPRWVIANTTYHFTVIPFNGGGSNFVNYNTNSPLTGSVSSPATMVSPSEYTSVDPLNTSFVTQLQTLINPHTSIFYSNYRPTMIEGFMVRDTFVVQGLNTFNKVITCSYSGAPILFNLPFDFTSTGTSREHTFPHSWMPTFPADNPEKPEYNDQHHLYPTIQANVNDARCNYPLGNVITPIIAYQEGVLGLDSSGNRVYEPRDEHKGAAARALFYMATCYNTVSGNSWNFQAPVGEVCAGGSPYNITYVQDQQVMKDWHYAYPPTSIDIARNDYLDSLQGNRNPFVDQPDWVCYINFENMTYIANPTIPCSTSTPGASINQQSQSVYFTLYPNPSEGVFNINVFSNSNETGVIKMFDLSGKLMMNTIYEFTDGNNTIQINKIYPSGVYLVEVITSNGSETKRLIIE